MDDCLTPILWHKIANGVTEAEFRLLRLLECVRLSHAFAIHIRANKLAALGITILIWSMYRIYRSPFVIPAAAYSGGM